MDNQKSLISLNIMSLALYESKLDLLKPTDEWTKISITSSMFLDREQEIIEELNKDRMEVMSLWSDSEVTDSFFNYNQQTIRLKVLQSFGLPIELRANPFVGEDNEPRFKADIFTKEGFIIMEWVNPETQAINYKYKVQ